MKRPLKNVTALILGDGGSRVIGFGVTVYLARILEPAGFGIITIGMAVLGYLLLAASPGIQTVEARNVAAVAHVDRERLGAVLSLRLVLALLLWLGTWGAAMLVIDRPETREIVILYAAAMVPLALVLDWFFAGREQFGPVGLSKVVNNAVYALVVIFFVRSAHDLRFTPVAFAFGALASAVTLFLLYRRQFGIIALRWDPAAWKRIAEANIPVGLATALGQNVTNLPPIVIGALMGASDAGQFSAAMKLVFVMLILDRLLNALFLPVMSRYLASRSDEIPQLFATVGRTVLLVILPGTVLSLLLAPWLVPMVFGEGYGDAVTLFRVLSPYAGLTVLSSMYVVTLIAAGRERDYTRLMMISSAVLAVLVLLLTPAFGPVGAAWGVVGGETVALVLLAREARIITGVTYGQLLLRPLAVTVPMTASFLLTSFMHPLFAALIGLGMFAAAALLAGGVRRDDIRFLRERFL